MSYYNSLGSWSHILKESMHAIQSNMRLWLYLSLGLMATPLMVFEVLQGYYGLQVAQKLKQADLAFPTIEDLILASQGFISLYLVLGLVSFVLVGAGYFTIISVVLAEYRNDIVRPGLIKRSLVKMIKYGLPLGFSILLLLLLLSQFPFFVLWIVGLGLMGPVLVSDKKVSVLGMLRSCFFLSYAGKSGASTWAVLIRLLLFGALLLSLTMIAGFLSSGPIMIANSLNVSPASINRIVVFEMGLPALLVKIIWPILMAQILSFFAVLYSTQYSYLVEGARGESQGKPSD